MSFLNQLTNLFQKKAKPVKAKVKEKPEDDEEEDEDTDTKKVTVVDAKQLDSAKTWKFTEDQKMILVNLVAQGLTRTQITQTCKDVHGFEPTASLIWTVRHSDKWEKLVMEARSKHFARMDLVDPSNKYVRVKRMDAIQERALKKGDLRSAISANEQIRKEFEKDSGDVNVYLQNNTLYQQFNTLSTEELLERQKQATKLLKEKTNGPGGSAKEDRKRQPQRIEAEESGQEVS